MQKIFLNKRYFSVSAGVILFITAMGKLWGASGNSEILRRADPILDLQFSHLMLIAGILELIVAGICFLCTSQKIVSILVSWLTTSFLIYRIGLWWIGWNRPCNCLGNFADALHISPQLADNIMKVALAYMLIGSYATLFWIWRQNRKESGRMLNDEI